MSIGKYRSRRNRAIPAAATIGAPLRGVFIVEITQLYGTSGSAIIETVDVDNSGATTTPKTWTPDKIIDKSAIEIWSDGIRVPVTAAQVNNDGNRIDVAFPVQGDLVTLKLIAGHPALTANNGAVCGGAIKNE